MIIVPVLPLAKEVTITILLIFFLSLVGLPGLPIILRRVKAGVGLSLTKGSGIRKNRY